MQVITLGGGFNKVNAEDFAFELTVHVADIFEKCPGEVFDLKEEGRRDALDHDDMIKVLKVWYKRTRMRKRKNTRYVHIVV